MKQIKIHRLNFPRAGEALGITIVIDVIRAFTVAAYAFSEWRQGNEADFPAEDIDTVLDADRFSFAMVGTRREWDGIAYVEVERIDLDL